uniref:Uncharacterized protein n=1 Tax=Cyprinus carpio carpio TaxID=630221 RepID=A0A8C1I0Q7_CYPCA
MSSKEGTKNVRNLDSDDASSLTQSIIERTPPSKSERVTTHQSSKPDTYPTSEQVVKDEPCDQVNKETLRWYISGSFVFTALNTNALEWLVITFYLNVSAIYILVTIATGDMEIILRSQSSSQLEGLDLTALLAKLKVADVHCTTAEEKAEVSRLKTEVEKAQVSREKEERLMKDTDSCKENINQIKLTVNIDTLKAEISVLESQLSGKETFKLNKGLLQ